MQGNSRLYCLPEEAFCHPETSAFYLKPWRRNGSVFQIYSLSTEHQRKGDEIGSEGGFWALIRTVLLAPAARDLWSRLLGSSDSVDAPYSDLCTHRTWQRCPRYSTCTFSGEAKLAFKVGVCFSELKGSQLCSFCCLASPCDPKLSMWITLSTYSC